MKKEWLGKKIIFSISFLDIAIVLAAFTLSYLRLGLKEALLFSCLIFGIILKPNTYLLTCFTVISLLITASVVLIGLQGKGDILAMLAFFLLFISVISAIFNLQKKS